MLVARFQLLDDAALRIQKKLQPHFIIIRRIADGIHQSDGVVALAKIQSDDQLFFRCHYFHAFPMSSFTSVMPRASQ